MTLSGRVDWPQRDGRAVLSVLACRRLNTDMPCDAMTVAPVAADGRYTLALSGGVWTVAPLIDAEGSRTSTPAVTVAMPRLPRPLNLAISAEVSEVAVDNGGQPGEEQGVVFCPLEGSCDGIAWGHGVGVDSDNDGDVLLVADAGVTYIYSGYVKTGADFTTWRYSPQELITGAPPEGHVFTVPV
jgi:hypothetical protein